jgi:transposase-like protein
MVNVAKIYQRFPGEEDCVAYLEDLRWGGEPMCPHCGSVRTTPLPKERRHRCNGCNAPFSVTVRTLFHRTHLPLQKWLLAISLLSNARKGISVRRLAKELEVNKNAAWSVTRRVRGAMMEPSQRALLLRIVEDEATLHNR